MQSSSQQQKKASESAQQPGTNLSGGAGAKGLDASTEYHTTGSEMKHARTDLKSGATPSKTSPTNRGSSKPGAAPADKSTIDVAKEKLQEGWEYVKEKAGDAVDAIRGKDECASGECATADKSGARKASPPRAGGAVGGQRATAKDPSSSFRPEAGTGRGASESAGVTGSSYKPSSELKAGQSDFQSKSGDVAGRGSTSSSQDFSKSSTHEFSKASDLKSGSQQQTKIGGQSGLQQQSGQQQRSAGGRA